MNEALTVAAIGGGIHGATAILLFLYPGEYDSAHKSRIGHLILIGNLLAAMAAGATISLVTWLGPAGFVLPGNAIPYLWCGVAILSLLLAFVHMPIAFSFRRADAHELSLLNDVIKIACDVLYGQIDAAVQELADRIDTDGSIMEERGLRGLAESIVARARASAIRPVDLTRLLLERASSLASMPGLRSSTPFRGINEMLTAAGAGIIVALSVQLALRGGA